MCRSVSFQCVIALLTMLVFAGCQHKPNQPAQSDNNQTISRATVVQVHRKNLVRTVELPGRAESYEFAPLCAKVTGYVQRVAVDIGDSIQGPVGDKPGSILCELLVPELNDELAEKTAAISRTKAEIAQSEAGVKVAEAALSSAEARIAEMQALVAKEDSRYSRWKSEYQRISQLADSGAVTRKVADETKSELDASDAGRQEATAKMTAVKASRREAAAKLEKARADAEAIRAQLDVVEAEKRRVETMLSYTVLRAPFDGVVVERNVHTGHLVRAVGENAQKALLTVMRVDPIRVFVDIPEDDAVHVSKSTKVELRVPSTREKPYCGTITRTSWSLNTVSRTLTAEIDVPNPEQFWRHGMYVLAKITVAEMTDVFSLPKTAIMTHDKQTFCYVVDANKKITKQPVTVGLQAGAEFEIREGLNGGEQVVVVNANTFREGQSVEPVAPAPPAK